MRFGKRPIGQATLRNDGLYASISKHCYQGTAAMPATEVAAPVSSQCCERPARRDQMSALKMIVTVDVEALPRRAKARHVERLIYGRFDGRSRGLREMMEEAEKLGFRLTCFFDYCEYDLYGEKFLEVAREIVSRGHDLQLHAHPELMREETWLSLGVPKLHDLTQCSQQQAAALFKWAIDLHARVSTRAPVAFRGGGYRYNANVLRAMCGTGLQLASNFSALRPGHEDRLGHGFSPKRGSLPYFYENGVLEVPISVLSEPDGRRLEFNFNAYGLQSRFDWFLDRFPVEYGVKSIMNLVMHSRSFLKLDAHKKLYLLANDNLFDFYKSLLHKCREKQIAIIGVDQVFTLCATGEIAMGIEQSLQAK